MKRSDVIAILDGTDPKFGRGIAFALNGLILLSAVAIAIETIPDLPPGLHLWLLRFEAFVLSVFVIEYLLRLTCSPSPLRYAFSIWGMIDLFACLPALGFINPEWQAARTLRLIRVIRLFKLFRTSAAARRLLKAFRQVRQELMVFLILSALMIYVSAVGIYLFEHEAQPDVFSSIPISFWWAVVSFTTVGYGDMYPITTGGRIFTTFVLFIGLGIVAVPTAIITAALTEEEIEETIEEIESTLAHGSHEEGEDPGGRPGEETAQTTKKGDTT